MDPQKENLNQAGEPAPYPSTTNNTSPLQDITLRPRAEPLPLPESNSAGPETSYTQAPASPQPNEMPFTLTHETASPGIVEEPIFEEPSALSHVANGFTAIVGAVFSWIIFPIAVVLILHNFVFQAYHVLGTSMVPTLHETDYLIISKLGTSGAMIERTFGKNAQYIPPRGQVIVFHYPKNPTQVFVKRVIAMPGERVVIKDGVVKVFNKTNPNGFNPDAKYERPDTVTLIDTDETIQPGNVFVMGDNRTPGGSYDSREWGQLPSSYIIGNSVLRLLPLDQVKVF